MRPERRRRGRPASAAFPGWQCRVISLNVSHASFEYPHVCVLPMEHFGAHQCWCGWNFTAENGRWVQERLPNT